ncbi:hypothetical protein SO802_031812 [Lithocarpus litseifolius]|uniref:Uncharacterized protein n=1 Tax=Lithocarpus litseifolius TaxID=425828 RepID=A0AAW2BNC7_9ROSI
MAGIMHKIEETLHIGGQKKEEQGKQGEQHHAAGDQHKGDQQHSGGEHKPEQKEGIVDKMKDKIHGDSQGKPEEGKKKKKEKKEKKHDGHDSSSSDSD